MAPRKLILINLLIFISKLIFFRFVNQQVYNKYNETTTRSAIFEYDSELSKEEHLIEVLETIKL